MIKLLYLEISYSDSIGNRDALLKINVPDKCKFSKKYEQSVLRYIKNITGSVGNFVKCMMAFK